jgi:hypothetical protein
MSNISQSFPVKRSIHTSSSSTTEFQITLLLAFGWFFYMYTGEGNSSRPLSFMLDPKIPFVNNAIPLCAP